MMEILHSFGCGISFTAGILVGSALMISAKRKSSEDEQAFRDRCEKRGDRNLKLTEDAAQSLGVIAAEFEEIRILLRNK